jgi:YebC/PmpR family DNA-binding regulatory protein
VAAKLGGGDASSNPRLRLAVDKAMDNNMPKDTIERAIRRGSGEQEAVNYEEMRYEGYGINGAAVIVDCLSDNRTRTVADIRHAFSKHGGNLGTDGSVAFLFKHCGQIAFAPGVDENRLLDVALDAGADDVVNQDDGSIEVLSTPHDFMAVKTALAKAGFKPVFAEVTMRPTTEVVLSGDDAARMQKLLDALETLDDVQNVYTTAVIEEG